MMSQLNFYSSPNVEKSSHEITMSAIAARLREVHAKMCRKDPPLPYAENRIYTETQTFIEKPAVEETTPNDKTNTLLNARLDEISHAILFDYQDRQKKETITFNALSSIIARLDEEQSSETVVTTTETNLSETLLETLYEQLEERFFKRQQTALDKLSSKIEQLSRDLREATAASRHNVQIIALESTIHEVHNLLKNQKLQKQSMESETEKSFQNFVSSTIENTKSDDIDMTLETLLNVTPEAKSNLDKKTDVAALSVLLKNMPTQSASQNQETQECDMETSSVLKTQQAKPFDIHASARLIAAARKNK